MNKLSLLSRTVAHTPLSPVSVRSAVQADRGQGAGAQVGGAAGRLGGRGRNTGNMSSSE